MQIVLIGLIWSGHASSDVQVSAHDPKTGLPYSYSITTLDTAAKPVPRSQVKTNPQSFLLYEPDEYEEYDLILPELKLIYVVPKLEAR